MITITKRQIIEIDEELCDGCGQCVPACEEGAIQIINGKARLVAERLCDGLGACLGHCPRGALKIVEREAEAFDEEAVKALKKDEEDHSRLACGCPGTMLREFRPGAPVGGPVPSALTHWPVQIRLVPPNAPFLQKASLLVAADCAGVSFPGLHQELLPGRKLLIGCPKFDPLEEYQEKFVEIFKNATPREVLILVMEVPCCRGLPLMVQRAGEEAGIKIPGQVLTVSLTGQIVGQEDLWA